MEHQKNYDKDQPKEFVEKLVKLNRTSKTVKGGRRMAFSALTVVGDKKVALALVLEKQMMFQKQLERVLIRPEKTS